MSRAESRCAPRELKLGDAVPLFTELPRETVRKVSDAPETKPYGPPKRGFLAHFGLRVPAKSTPGASLAPFSDSFRRGILGNWASGVWSSRKPRAREKAGM